MSSTANNAADSAPHSSRAGRLEAITNPGAVKINVKGAFIVDDEPRSKSPVNTNGVHYENKDIRLPHHKGIVSHVAVDVSLPNPSALLPRLRLTAFLFLQIGGSLAKLVYFTRELDSPDNGGRLNFISFETHRIGLCIDFIKQLKQEHVKLNGSSRDGLCVVATGGGAYKYYDKLKEALDVNILREDEMACLITGMRLATGQYPKWTNSHPTRS